MPPSISPTKSIPQSLHSSTSTSSQKGPSSKSPFPKSNHDVNQEDTRYSASSDPEDDPKRYEMDVDDEIDELLSDRDDREREGEDGSNRTPVITIHDCKWGDCSLRYGSMGDLVKHVHLGTGKEIYVCEWEGCGRRGQKQATRHSLLTHIRAHTGERPYSCPQPGCKSNFTRSDAMSKHLRTLHGINPDLPKSKKKAEQDRSVLTQLPLPDDPSTSPFASTAITNNTSIQSVFVAPKRSKSSKSLTTLKSVLTRQEMATDDELRLDAELDEVVPRVRERSKLVLSHDEIHAVKTIRDRYPRKSQQLRQTHAKLNPSTSNGSNPEDKFSLVDYEADDSFDEGVSSIITESTTSAQTRDFVVIDLATHESGDRSLDVPVIRTKWQAKYIMAKAKLMLAEEENYLRRQKLEELEGEEVQELARFKAAVQDYEAKRPLNG